MNGDDLVKDGASATGMFGMVAPEPAKEVEKEELARVVSAEPVAPIAALATPATSASSGGFTQLLRALNYDAVREASVAAPAIEVQTGGTMAAPALGGPMTQLLRTIGSPAAGGSTANKPEAPSNSSQVTSFPPQSAPLASVVPVVALSPAQAGGSFTQLFQRLEAEPVVEVARDESVSAASFTPLFAAPEPATDAVKPVEPFVSAPGSFTQLFAGVNASAARVVEAAPVGVSAGETANVPAGLESRGMATPAGSPGSFTQIFQALGDPAAEPARNENAPVTVESIPPAPRVAEPTAYPVEAPPAVSLAAPASLPGSFTQMFQALDAPVMEPVRREEIPLSAEPAAGSFTQMFQALGTPEQEEARYVPPSAVEVPKQAAAQAPGSFTQMFRTPGEEPQKAEAGPGSFTRLFGSPSAPAVPPPPSSYNPPFAASTPGREESGASQLFATYREPPQQPVERGPVFSPVEAAPTSRPPVSLTPSSGGLTQLLRTLDQPTPKPYAAPSYPSPAAPQPGSFTGVYGALGSPTETAAPVAPVAAPQPPFSAGPSEFTRLINASALREAGLRGGGEAAPAAPAEASAAGGAGFSMPSGLPKVPHASLSAPAAPQVSVSGPGGAHGTVSAAGGGQASFSAPKLPSAPSARLPEMPKAVGAPAAGIQKYVPLLLILVIFLLLAILVAVVVLMKK